MVDGNSEIGAHMWGDMGYLIWAVTNLKNNEKTFFSSYVRNVLWVTNKQEYFASLIPRENIY